MKRGKMKINLSNKLLYTFITLGILILLSVGVYAYGTSNPAVFGHSAGELEIGSTSLNVVNTGNTQFELRSTNGGTPYMDFSNDASTDFDARFILVGDNYLTLDGAYFSVSPEGEGQYTSTYLRKWGLLGDGDIFIEPAPGKTLSLTDQWSRTGTLSIQFGSVVSSSGIYAPAFIYSSDRSLKTNIQPLTNSLEKVKQLQGVSFNWKESGDESIGLVAQDVEKVIPEIVHTSEDGLKSVEYGNIVAVLIEAVKEQQKQIEELKEKCN